MVYLLQSVEMWGIVLRDLDRDKKKNHFRNRGIMML